MTQKSKENPSKKDQKKVVPVTKDSNLGEIIYNYPNTAEVFLDYGMHCVGCFAASFDTIEAGAVAHGLSADDIGEMVQRVNEVINFKE